MMLVSNWPGQWMRGSSVLASQRCDADCCGGGRGEHTLFGTLGDDIAVGVHLELRAGPGDIEVSLDDHVGC